MKKTFQIIGLISLTCFSFFITEKTNLVVSNLDDIMIQIKQNKDKYSSESKDAIINNDTIIPGISGKTVNISKSYKSMKNNGYYNEKLFVYDYTKPKISIEENLDKYIIKGNPRKRMVSLIFNLYNNDDISEILNIVNNYNVKVNFFVDYNWFSNNTDLIKEIINNGHLISPLMEDYNNTNFEWIDTILKNVNRQRVVFCYKTNYSKENIEICKLKGDYTISPTKISDNTPLVDIKNKLESGSILTLSNNKEVKKELSSIIIYIKSKGLTIENLENHILE